MFGKKFFYFLVILFICAALKTENNKRLKHDTQKNAKSNRQSQQNFHEVDAFGDDFIDFGAQTGPKGQFVWHADFPLE